MDTQDLQAPRLLALGDAAWTVEFGREISRQSALALLFFIATNKRQAFTPFGVFSDERFHIVEGNDRVATGLATLLPTPVALGPGPGQPRGGNEVLLLRDGTWAEQAVLGAIADARDHIHLDTFGFDDDAAGEPVPYTGADYTVPPATDQRPTEVLGNDHDTVLALEPVLGCATRCLVQAIDLAG